MEKLIHAQHTKRHKAKQILVFVGLFYVCSWIISLLCANLAHSDLVGT